MHQGVVLAIVVAITGCKDDTTKPQPEPSAARQLTCDQILPAALRDRYFPNAKPTDVPQPLAYSAECQIDDGSPAGSTIAVSCHDSVRAAMEATLDDLRRTLHPDELPAVGAAAVSVNKGRAGHMVSAWDDDSNCQATMTLREGIDPADFTKALFAGYPPR